jgi:hypothetical protein
MVGTLVTGASFLLLGGSSLVLLLASSGNTGRIEGYFKVCATSGWIEGPLEVHASFALIATLATFFVTT